jgi:VTC domain
MTSDRLPSNRPLLSRYELKYWLPPPLIPDLRRHLRPFCRTDKFSTGRPGNRYTVGSLYLDTQSFELYRTTVEGHTNRFKLRIRSYKDDPEAPVFFEIKKRANQIVLKRRAKVPREIAKRFLAGDPVPRLCPAFEQFLESCHGLDARPTLRVRYEREAYESRGGDPLRITIDHDVMHAVSPGPDLSLNGAGWVRTPTRGAILEVKFTDRSPAWVAQMVRTLGLERTSIPKYVLSLDRVFASQGHAPWSRSIGGRS